MKFLTRIISWIPLAAVMLALVALLWLLWHSRDGGVAPVTFLLSGRAFRERPLVIGGSLDQPSLHKEWFIFCYSIVLVIPCLAFVRWISGGHRRVVQLICAALSSIFLLHPVSILTIFTYDVSRYILAMGTTPKRLLGISLSCVSYAAIGLFAAWIWHSSNRLPDQRLQLAGDTRAGQ